MSSATRLYLLCLLFIIGFSKIITAQTDSTANGGETFTAPLPVVFYTPETNLGIGAALIRNFYPGAKASPRPSQLQLGGAYTFNKQLLFFFSYQLFLRDGSREIFGELGYYDYIYFYYGIGNETQQVQEETYAVKFPRFRINMLEEVFPNFRAGLSYKFDAYDITGLAESGLLESNQPTGFEGGNISTLGAILRYDTRDNVNLPLNGWYVTLTLEQNAKWLGSSFNYSRALLDVVKYIPVGEKQTIALNTYTGTMGGQVPFQELLFIGGSRKGRGIIEGRFRDKSLLLFQAAYRFPIFWRIRGAVFASSGRVGATYGQLWKGTHHLNYGAGLRFLLNEKEQLQVRFDVGLGGDGLGYYLFFSDAF
ncbi:MAG: BamA/TamA family outer membrane protein [Saprospiraceae bacterium]